MEDNRTFLIYVLFLFFMTFGVAMWVFDGAPIPGIEVAKLQPNKEMPTFQKVTSSTPVSHRVPKGPLPELPRFGVMAKLMSMKTGKRVSADDMAYGILNSLNDVIFEYGNLYLKNPCEKPIRVYVKALIERHFLIKARHPKLVDGSYVRSAGAFGDKDLMRTMAEVEPATTGNEVTKLIAKLVRKGLLTPDEFRRGAAENLKPYAADVGPETVQRFRSCQAANSTE